MAFAVVILALVLPYMLGRAILRRVQATAAMKRLIALAIKASDTHSAALVGKERQTVFKDEYGTHCFEAMNREVDRFLQSAVIYKAQTGDYLKASRRFDVKDALREVVYKRLYEVHIPAADEAELDHPVAIPENHKAFEHWCAQVLGGQGWDAHVVGGSGDQGADVIATKDGVVLVVQCKRWAAAVTNKAVQEIAAARAHYDAQSALVVSASGFTASARMLAQTNGVMLVDAAALGAGNGWMN